MKIINPQAAAMTVKKNLKKRTYRMHLWDLSIFLSCSTFARRNHRATPHLHLGDMALSSRLLPDEE